MSRADRRGDSSGTPRPRRPLFYKYFVALFVAVVVPLMANGASEAWFGYRDQRSMLSARLHAEAVSAAGKIAAFLGDITDQLQWTVQLPWRDGMDERHRFDVLRLMRQVPAVVEVTLVDGTGVERLRVTRVDPDAVDSGIDRANDPAVLGARSRRIWYGPVTLHEGSEPHMTIAVAGARAGYGVTIAEINLKLIWDVISAIHVGQSGDAFVLDRSGRLVAHPDISLVLRGDDDPVAARLKALQQATIAGSGETETAPTPSTAPSSRRWRRSPARIGRPLSRNPRPRLSCRSARHCGGPDACCLPVPCSPCCSVICWCGG